MRFPFLLKCLAVLLALTAPTLWAGGSPPGSDQTNEKPASGIFLLAAGFDLGPETPKSQTASRILVIPGKKCGGGLDPVNRWDPSGLAAYFFDGTGNHPEPMERDGKTPNFRTNIHLLFEAYNDPGKKRYYAYGIGSGYLAGGELDPRWADGQKLGGGTMEERVDWMIQNLETELDRGDKVVDVFGFSRGAASASLFLNKIKENMNDPAKKAKYEGIQIRMVGLFDQVPSHASGLEQIGGRSLDTLGYLGSLTIANPDYYARHANDPGFTLPTGMEFSVKPLHLVALDEQRKEFAVSDLQGALQIGFRGVHSNVGGFGENYGPIFSLITREFMVNYARENKLDVFDMEKITKMGEQTRQSQPWKDLVSSLENGKRFDYAPTNNSDWKFNDNEPRTMPQGLMMHRSVYWFQGVPKNWESSYSWRGYRSPGELEFGHLTPTFIRP